MKNSAAQEKNKPFGERIRDAAADLFGKIPPIGGLLSWILKYLGWTALISFVLGGTLVAVLVGSGVYPERFISKKYNLQPPTINRAKPHQLPITIETKVREDWLSDHVYWLEQEADRQKEAKEISDYLILVVYSDPVNATPDFNWLLRGALNLQLSCRWASRILTSSKFIQPLEPAKISSTSFDSIRIPVPPCEKGDTLVAVLRVSSTLGAVPADKIEALVTSLTE